MCVCACEEREEPQAKQTRKAVVKTVRRNCIEENIWDKMETVLEGT